MFDLYDYSFKINKFRKILINDSNHSLTFTVLDVTRFTKKEKDKGS